MIESFFCVENVELVKLEIICYLILFDVIIWFEFKEKSHLEKRLKSGICVWMNTTYSKRVRIERGKFHAFDGNYFEDLRKWFWKKRKILGIRKILKSLVKFKLRPLKDVFDRVTHPACLGKRQTQHPDINRELTILDPPPPFFISPNSIHHLLSLSTA